MGERPPRSTAITVMVALMLSFMLFLAGCGGGSGDAERPVSTAPATGAEGPLKDVRYFAYQIQGQEEATSIDRLAASRYDLLVIDQTSSLKGEEGYDSRAVVTRLKDSPSSSGGGKLVVCYVDVGEAESYRAYWRDGWRVGDPEWIVATDPDGWDENYPVKFWREQWKDIMRERFDSIIDDGYDGAYLDWLEVYSFEPVAEAARAEGLDPRAALVDFTSELAAYARSKKPGFIMIAQNAAEMGSVPEYAAVFDGIGQEAVWFDGAGDPDQGETDGDVPRDGEESRTIQGDLSTWLAQGKPVLDVEYAARAGNAAEAYRLGAEHGYRTYVTLRPLDALSDTPPSGLPAP